MSARYPLFLDLHGRRVLVVGAGNVAGRRLPGLLDAGAHVTVVAPRIGETVSDLAGREGLRLLQREYDDALLADAVLVLACTDDPSVNEWVTTAASNRGIWCVRTDTAADSPAWVPARAVVDDVEIAVSGGGDPARARALRDAVEALLRSGILSARRRRRDRDGSGRVVLVGGGPGHPDLLTLQGFRALLDADVVVHDRLSPGSVLGLLPPEVEVIDVGKTPGGPAAAQVEINALLVDRARAGSLVVRLKGGDPFIFGRGSEEVAACAEAGIGVTVVPGLTSATSAPTLAGVPLTERGTNQLFTVASGHAPPGDPASTVDWAALAAAGGTLVLLMAVANLRAIAAALVEHGREGDVPVVVVENASLPDQRVLTATLAEAAADGLAARGITAPAVVVVAEVAGRT